MAINKINTINYKYNRYQFPLITTNNINKRTTNIHILELLKIAKNNLC
jgi:hypothetical protein